MKKLLTRVGTATLATIIAGCAQVGGALQKAGETIANAGKTKSEVQTGIDGGEQLTSHPRDNQLISTTGNPAQENVGQKQPPVPETAVDVCARNNISLNYLDTPSGYGNYNIRVKDKDGRSVWVEMNQAQDNGRDLLDKITGTKVTSDKYAECMTALSGRSVPTSCVNAKALVAFNVVSPPYTPFLNGYERLTYKNGKDVTIAQMPNLNGGVVNLTYPSRPKDRANCTRDLQR